jgi:hypothetical protein
MEIVALLDNALANRHRTIRKLTIQGNAKKKHFGDGRLSNDGMKAIQPVLKLHSEA